MRPNRRNAQGNARAHAQAAPSSDQEAPASATGDGPSSTAPQPSYAAQLQQKLNKINRESFAGKDGLSDQLQFAETTAKKSAKALDTFKAKDATEEEISAALADIEEGAHFKLGIWMVVIGGSPSFWGCGGRLAVCTRTGESPGSEVE